MVSVNPHSQPQPGPTPTTPIGAVAPQPDSAITPEARAESRSYWQAFTRVHAILHAPFAVIIVGVVLYGVIMEPLVRYIVGSTVLLMLLITWAWRRAEQRAKARSASVAPALRPK